MAAGSFDPQHEVGVRAVRAEELVLRQRRIQAAADHRAVLDAKRLVRLAVPAFEALSVEERPERQLRRVDVARRRVARAPPPVLAR